jgi:hypothetical protein
MRLGRLFSVAALAASLLLVGTPSRAATVPLPSNLGALVGNSTTVGDKTFDFISADATSFGGGSTPIPIGSVAVTALTAAVSGTVAPFGFELSGPFSAVPGSFNDLTVKYTMASSGPAITAVNLFANANVTGSGFAEIVESVFANNNGAPGAFIGQIFASPGHLTDTLAVAPTSSLYIVKDIMYNVPTTGTATFSIIGQTSTQGVIPEPTSIVMLGVGLLGVGGFTLRRRLRSC